jgi:hypothetical protein
VSTRYRFVGRASWPTSAFLLGLALVLWLAVVGLWNSPRETPVFAAAVTAFTLLYTFVVLFVLYAAGPALREPVSARFTPDGWELPPLRMRGSWTDVRAIRVRPLAARGSTAGTPQLAAFRVVALIVDDPKRADRAPGRAAAPAASTNHPEVRLGSHDRRFAAADDPGGGARPAAAVVHGRAGGLGLSSTRRGSGRATDAAVAVAAGLQALGRSKSSSRIAARP